MLSGVSVGFELTTYLWRWLWTLLCKHAWGGAGKVWSLLRPLLQALVTKLGGKCAAVGSTLSRYVGGGFFPAPSLRLDFCVHYLSEYAQALYFCKLKIIGLLRTMLN